MLEARDLTFTTGGATLLHAASASFEAGTVTGLLGPNGAGKSTLLKLLAGLLPPTEGTVFCGDDDLAHLPQSRRARRIAYMPQDIPSFPPMPVREIASLGRLPYGEAPGVALAHPSVSMAIGLTGLEDLAARSADRLSGGERARLMLARALAVEAPVLLADEPVAALDPAHALGVMRVLRALAAEGCCVVLVIHDLLLATCFCDRLVVMKDGAIRYALPAAALSGAMVQEVYGVDVRHVEGAMVPWG